MAVCKDNDEIYTEWVHIEKEHSAKLMAKAKRILAAANPPDRIAKDPSWFTCKFCDHHAVCWDGRKPEPHCRTCLHSTPVAGGEWHCARGGCVIPYEVTKEGCPAHLYIPSLIAGKQVDSGPDWVAYEMADGTTWRDSEIPF
jgi:hypothetical protein